MSYDLRLVIEGYVEHCINQKAQEEHLAKLNAQLDEIEEKADRWDEKETPYVITDSDGIFGTCKCNCVVSNPQIYCHNCGRRITFESDGE